MEAISTCAFPVTSLVWQPRAGTSVFTVVCKVTYALRPGECALAPLQVPPAEDETYWDDDPSRSLRCPRDLVPVKPGVDVMLVGHCFAPERRPVRSIDARLVVGEIDKTIEASVDRAVRPDGTVREGQPFTSMPLRYERAGGGPGTANPIGVRRDGRDAEGNIVLPNLTRPGASLANAFEPVGFGPIAASWPERRDRLGANASWAFSELRARPLPDGMDLGFFNAAPRDQQLRGLGDRIAITLENLHPDHARLVTSIAVTAPVAVIEGRREGRQPLALRADTLWIDTDRAIATLTFRGSVPLSAADEPGRVLISTGAERPAAEPAVRVVEGQPLARPPRKLAGTADIPLEVRRKAMGGVKNPTLPFSVGAFSGAAAPPEPPPPAAWQPPPPPASPWATGAPAMAQSPIVQPPIVQPIAVPIAPVRRSDPPAAVPEPAVIPFNPGAAPGAFDASTGAIGDPLLRLPGTPEPAPQARIEPARAEAPLRVEPAEPVELVWFDPESVPRIRRKDAWRPILDALEEKAPDPEFDDPAFGKDPMVVEDRREVFEVLAQGGALGAEGVETAYARCLRADGRVVPCLELVGGELELPFDEIAALRATVATVAPLAGTDDNLKAAIATAKDFLATPDLMSSPAVAEALTRRIEEAFAQGKRAVQPGYVEAQRERALLERRQYQRRAVFGAKHLRGLLRAPGADGRGQGGKQPVLVPTYLPESLADMLPMYPRFRVRLVAEIRPAVDRYETHAAALRVMAVARIATGLA